MKYTLLSLLCLISFGVFAQDSYLEIKNQEDIKQGDKIELAYITNTRLSSDSWIGLYKKGASTANTSDGRISYGYVKDSESYTNTWTGPALPGAYEFRLISGKKLLFTLPFNVIALDEREVELELLTERILPSQEFKFKIKTDLNINRNSRLGTYNYSPKQSKSQSGYINSSFYYSRSNDIMTLNAPDKVGVYEVRFHGSNKRIFIKRLVFLVGDPNLDGLSYSLDKQVYAPGETITLTYTGNQDLFERTWFGMFNNSETKYYNRLAYRFIDDKLKGTISFEAPATEGNYSISWFYADQGPQLLESKNFKVQGSIAEAKNMQTESFKEQLETSGKIILYGIYFDFNKSTIRPESRVVIKQLAELLNTFKSFTVSIDGHTDDVGTEHYNQKLSEARAQAVIKMLVGEYDVDRAQLSFNGYGESKPINNNTTEAERAKNRRVEVVKK